MKHKVLLLVNLGSPASPKTVDVRRYLNEFLMDKNVIDTAAPLRFFLVRGLIAPFRAPKSAAAYAKIWTENGSPLVHSTRVFAEKFQTLRPDLKVLWAMRYGQPSIKSVLKEIAELGDVDLLVAPLYPQYAKSSTRTAIQEVEKALKRLKWPLKMSSLPPFYDRSPFLETFAQNIREAQESFRADHLLLSYHGLPERHIKETDLSHKHCLNRAECCSQIKDVNRNCYRAQCYATSRELTARSGFASENVTVSFQSRLGREPWIQPFTDQIIFDLIKQGKRRLLVACPSFVADCLETLEEIQIRLRKDFIQNGGEDLRLVPSLNESDRWVKAFNEIVKSFPA